MAQLNKNQKQKLDDLVSNKKFFKMVNDFLKENGADDLQLQSFTVQPKKNPATAPANINFLAADHGLRDDVPICPHGFPMVERCTRGGRCQWVCNH